MAAEPKLSSKKRKREAHHPLVGIFTRSKSQIYLHRNRSGRSRSDFFCYQSQSQSLSKEARRRDLIPHSSAVDDMSSILVKDLRTRRIFSDGYRLRGSNEEVEKEDTCKKRIGISESGFSEKARSDEDGGVVSNVLTTTSDIDLFIGTEQLEKNGSPKMDSFSEKQSNGSDQNGFSANIDRRNGNNDGIKPLLGLRSRTKLFKAPGSFSYRRLLPYLMDVSKDYARAPIMDQSPKINKGLEEKPVLTSHDKDILIDKSKIESNNVEYVNEGSNSASIQCIKESSISFDSQKELCMSRDFSLASNSVVEEWPQPVLNGREKFDLKSSRKYQNLNDSKTELCENKNDSVRAISDDAKLMDKGEAGKIEAENSCYTQNMNNSNCFSKGTMRSKTGEGYTSDVREYSKVQDLYHTNSDMSDIKPNDSLSNSKQGGGDGDEPNQEYILMTPPDADIFGKPEVAENGGNSVKSILSAADHDFWKPMDLSIKKNSSCLGDKSIDSSPRKKWVLNRCSRPKLFKVPGSMSYRRMLPFLINVTEDNSCALGKDHLKLEKCSVEKPTLPSSVSDIQEMPIENSDVNDCHTESDISDFCAPLITISTASWNDQESNPSYNHVNESPKPCNSQQERVVDFEQEKSDIERKLGTGPEMIDINHGSNTPALPLPSLLGSGSLSRGDAKFVSNELSVHIREDCTQSVIKVTNGEKETETDSLRRDSSYLEASLHLDIPTTALNKGILKRTPGGCRGLCTCLNCSSFRLNAERAFEFSSNQMQDTEEVALDLIKELSYMRNMLEESALGDDGCAVVCINQVKQACKRASEAEELAQNRLSQMHFDLKVHCRITCAERPRVRFANRVEEQVITYSDLPSK
ncbi:hypothetical protein ACOSP7_006980 [Xanthoceras sorbifolium]